MFKFLCAVVGAISMLAKGIPPGTDIQVRLDARIEMSTWDRGRIYPASIARDVIAKDGDVSVPRSSQVELIVREVAPGQYTIDVESITTNGQRYAVDTSGPQVSVPRDDGSNGLIGAIAEGIACTVGEQVETKGREIRLPVGSLITFRLLEPLRVVNWTDPGYQQGPYHYHSEHDWYR
jgi:hypothetical protein